MKITKNILAEDPKTPITTVSDTIIHKNSNIHLHIHHSHMYIRFTSLQNYLQITWKIL